MVPTTTHLYFLRIPARLHWPKVLCPKIHQCNLSLQLVLHLVLRQLFKLGMLQVLMCLLFGSSATSSSVSSPPGVAVPNLPSVHSQIPVHHTFSSANVSSVAGNTFDKSSSQSLDCENITTDDDTTSGKKTVNIEMRENQKNSRQRQEDDRNNDEAIVSDIVNGCAEDEEGYYFDEYGMGLTGSSSKVAPSERPNIPIVSTAEELMSFEAFAEIERDGPFQPSQEDSDIEPEPPLSQSTSQFTNSASSDEEINKIPEKQRKTSRPKKRKWSKNKMPYAKCLNMEVEMVDSIPWDVDGDHRFQSFLRCQQLGRQSERWALV